MLNKVQGRSRAALAGIALAIGAVGVAVAAGAPLGAAGTVAKGYTVPAITDSTAGAITGEVTAPGAVAGFPGATFISTSNAASIATSATLTAASPFGAVFGNSSGQKYLIARYAPGTTASTTTFTFAHPTPSQVGSSGWGFTLGDIDADTVTVAALDADGTSLTGAELGFQGTFNYASGADLPTWDESTATLTGSGVDTEGASGWFRPTVPISELTITFTPLTGFPVFQVWMAAAGGMSVGGTATECVDGAVEPDVGATVSLLDSDGNPVTLDGDPLVATTAADGTFQFDGLVPSEYSVSLAGVTTAADASSADATGLEIGCTTPPSTSTTTTTTTTSTSSTTTTTTTVPTTTSSTTTTTSTSTTSTSTSTSTTSTAVPTTSTTLPPTIAVQVVNPVGPNSAVLTGGNLTVALAGCVGTETVRVSIGSQQARGTCRPCNVQGTATGCCTVTLRAPTTPGTYSVNAVFTASRPTTVIRSGAVTVVSPSTTVRPTTAPATLPKVGQSTAEMSRLPLLLLIAGAMAIGVARFRRP